MGDPIDLLKFNADFQSFLKGYASDKQVDDKLILEKLDSKFPVKKDTEILTESAKQLRFIIDKNKVMLKSILDFKMRNTSTEELIEMLQDTMSDGSPDDIILALLMSIWKTGYKLK